MHRTDYTQTTACDGGACSKQCPSCIPSGGAAIVSNPREAHCCPLHEHPWYKGGGICLAGIMATCLQGDAMAAAVHTETDQAHEPDTDSSLEDEGEH